METSSGTRDAGATALLRIKIMTNPIVLGTHSSTIGSSVLKAEARSVKKAPKAAPVSAHRCTRTSMPSTVAYRMVRKKWVLRRRDVGLTLSLAGGPTERSTAAFALSISAMRAYLLRFLYNVLAKHDSMIMYHRTCQYLTPR